MMSYLAEGLLIDVLADEVGERPANISVLRFPHIINLMTDPFILWSMRLLKTLIALTGTALRHHRRTASRRLCSPLSTPTPGKAV